MPSTAIAVYRVSTSDQANGLEVQRAACHRWAESNGREIVAEFTDEGVSGAAPLEKRPGLLDAIDALTRGAVLLIHKRDRLARSVLNAAIIEKMVDRKGASIVTSDGIGAEDTPEAELMAGILDVFAAFERSTIAARTRRSMRLLWDGGRRIGPDSAIRYGMRYVDNVAVEHPVEAAVAREIVALRRGGDSYRVIAAKLGTKGLRQGTKSWHPNMVRKVWLKASRQET